MNNKFFITILLSFIFLACGGNDEPKDNNDNDKNKPSQPDETTTNGIDQFTNENIFSINNYLLSSNAIQTFDLDSNGRIWFLQNGTKHNELNLVYSKRNLNKTPLTTNSEWMKLLYFGHGTNAAVEEDGDERYLWLGAYASCNKSGQYWSEKVIARVKYQKGITVKTNECNDYFYIVEYHDMHPAIDADNDILTINYADDSNSNYRCFRMFRLSDAKKASKRIVNIKVTDGFETGNIASTNIITVPVYCHDLTTLKPIADVKFLKTGYGSTSANGKAPIYYDWQGFDVYKDRLYYVDGQSNYNLNKNFDSDVSHAYVTVFNFQSKIVKPRTAVAIISNREKLKEIGVTVFCALEAEGVKVKGDKIYLGYTAQGIDANSSTYYQNIFYFNK